APPTGGGPPPPPGLIGAFAGAPAGRKVGGKSLRSLGEDDEQDEWSRSTKSPETFTSIVDETSEQDMDYSLGRRQSETESQLSAMEELQAQVLRMITS
ncbi:hypothetical protein COOONC_13853, partial [Cooperia oncophora]